MSAKMFATWAAWITGLVLAAAPVANVLVYHLSEAGQHSVCVVSR